MIPSYYETKPPAIIGTYQVDQNLKVIFLGTTENKSKEEIVRNFFEKNIATLDRTYLYLKETYPKLIR